MAPHFDGPSHLLRAICRRFSELGAIRHENDGPFVSSKGKEPSVSTKVGNCFASSLKSAFEGRHKAVELILGISENIRAFV